MQALKTVRFFVERVGLAPYRVAEILRDVKYEIRLFLNSILLAVSKYSFLECRSTFEGYVKWK
jgi:hypothetical protein